MAFTLDDVIKYSEKPASIPTGGSYGEGIVYNISDMLGVLKEGVKSGKVSLTDYQNYAAPLINQASASTASIAGSGSKPSSSVIPAWQAIQSNGFASLVNGKLTPVIPFSRSEYAKLPDSVLPTQSDVNQGLFDPTYAPLQRFKSAPTPQVNPGPGAQPGVTPGNTTTTSQTGTSPVYTANPNAPAPYGGLANDNSRAAIDAQKIAQEAALQQQLAVQAANERASSRKKYLSDLSGLITQQNEQTLSEKSPFIQEELNAKGLLRSSELGNAIAREQKSLAATSANALGQAGLAAEQQDLGDFKSIQDAYNSARNSALQRQFSVEDYQTQLQAGKEMGAEYSKLTPNQGKAGSPGGAAAGAIIGGLAAGIPTGGAAAPAGITAGASIGNSVGGK